ncbi:MAG TPA: 30S ribosomal protein S12 methylthiotransferase RimO [Spirochaetota bacterium]|nr:30S ribosomal protein S12 methylthiotransferase RimO [Spirochaetota bacterium]
MFQAPDISFYIISLGCAKNLVDSERVNGEMRAIGFQTAPSPEEANILIVNTCGFIEEAKKESIEVILDAAEIGDGIRSGFGRKLVAAGCLSQRYRHEVAADIREIDFIYGIIDDGFVPALCDAFGIAPAGAVGGHVRKLPLIEALPYRYIKIAEGCSNNCSYCAIPLIRGPMVSFPPERIMEDAEAAVSDGAKELIVIAQDIASYRHGRTDLADLVRRVSEIRGVEWVRLLYCHPDHIDGRIIDLLRDNERIVKYIDIPFQHASRSILYSMGRKGDAAMHLALVEELRARVAGIRIRSTFMVGYPGETDGDFGELMRFVERAALDRVGAFVYSPEEGTRAVEIDQRVAPAVARRRHARLMKLQQGISAKSMERLVGRTVRVLVEERIDEHTWAGRTEYDAPEVDGIFYLTGGNVSINSIVKARVTGSTEYDASGVLV